MSGGGQVNIAFDLRVLEVGFFYGMVRLGGVLEISDDGLDSRFLEGRLLGKVEFETLLGVEGLKLGSV